MDWTRTKESKGEMSAVCIALEADGTVCAIYCLLNAQQVLLRSSMLDENPSVQFSGNCEDMRNTNAARAQSNASAIRATSQEAQFEEMPDGKWKCLEPCVAECQTHLSKASRLSHAGGIAGRSTKVLSPPH
jgi:hypothetical protein